MSSSNSALVNFKICNVCSKTIAKNHGIIHCQICNSRVHIKCNKTDVKTYNKIKTDHLAQICFQCQTQNKPLQNLSDTQLTDNDATLVPVTSNPKIHCGICKKTIAKNHLQFQGSH